ncbi:MAG: TonB-dependent receptor [Leptolyngbyaceae cyanobacterium SU_3_3]|nr:TonB-dependent receptor [Leptolyngbyaceae cyanobacterium SU_3_3]
MGEPELAKEEFTSHNVALNFLHEFSDNWQYRLGFNGLFQDVFDEGVVQRTLQADRRTLNRRFDRRTNDLTNLALQNEILGKFNTGSIQHELLFGVEYFLLEYAYTFANAPIGPIDIFNPVYGARPTRSLIQTTNGAYGSNNVGVYLQDLITLLPNLKLLAGVRFDNVYSFFEDRDPQETINEVSDNNFSPRFGILYQPSNSTSLYASYSQSFTPQFFGTNSRGGAFKPEETEQFEVGVRQGFFNNRLLGSLAAYQVTRKNVSTPDISTPEDFDRIQVGGATKSRD